MKLFRPVSARLLNIGLAVLRVIIGVIFTAQTLSLTGIVTAQKSMWYIVPQFFGFLIFLTASFAETNRAPFDVVEGESEIVAGHMIEYSGMTFALFFLAEYMNMILISALTVVMFFGGWQAPWDSAVTNWVPPFVWLFAKIFLVVSMFLWFRATFPRYRYDQIMRLGWKIFIPLTLAWIAVIGLWMQPPWNIWQ